MKLRAAFAVALLVFAAVPLSAELPFGKSWAEGMTLPKTYGIGIDIFSMDQGYVLDSLALSVPGLVIDPNNLEVDNNLSELNLKVDAWLFPFMNVFGIVGEIDGTTKIDLRGANAQLPFENLVVDYDGLVYGGGLVLIYGGERFFTSLTYAYTEADLGGDFDSTIETQALMPRIGVHGGKGAFWVGGMYLDTEEVHSGRVMVPVLGDVGFDATLTQEDDWNFTTGASVTWGESFTISIEGGFGDRTTTLISGGYRF
jgi:hypothetical protein